jgi:hypothetical protein
MQQLQSKLWQKAQTADGIVCLGNKGTVCHLVRVVENTCMLLGLMFVFVFLEAPVGRCWLRAKLDDIAPACAVISHLLSCFFLFGEHQTL